MCTKILLVVVLLLRSAANTSQFEFTNSFGHCLKQEKPNIVKCAGQQAIETLQQFNEVENFTLADGVVVSKDDSVMGRSSPINFLEQDPNDFRSLLENAGAVMGERSLQWDMSRVFPGLQLRVGPSVSGGLMEFVMDPSVQYDERSTVFQEESTARIMSKKFVLPFLLGLKFNLATLLPIILGAIILISKKAAFLSKLALFISGFFGVGGLVGGLGGFGGGGGFDGGHHAGYGYYQKPLYHDSGHGGLYKVLENNTPRTHEELHDNFYDYDKKHLLKDRSSRLYEREIEPEKISKYRSTNQRTFVWAPSNPN